MDPESPHTSLPMSESPSAFDVIVAKENMLFEAVVLGLEGAAETISDPATTTFHPDVCAGKHVLVIGSMWPRAVIEAAAAVAASVVHAVNEVDTAPFVGIPNTRVVSLASPKAELRAALPLKWSLFNELYMVVLRVGLAQPGCTDDDDDLHDGLKLLAKRAGQPLHAFLAAKSREGDVDSLLELAHQAGHAHLSVVRERADVYVPASAVPCVFADKDILVVVNDMSDPKVYLKAVTTLATRLNRTEGKHFVAGVLLREDPEMGAIRIAAMPTDDEGGSAEWLGEPPFNGGGHPTWKGATARGAHLSALVLGKDLRAIVVSEDTSLPSLIPIPPPNGHN